jgi:hypothetical protein
MYDCVNRLRIIRMCAMDGSGAMVAQFCVPVMSTLRSKTYFAEIAIIPLIDSITAFITIFWKNGSSTTGARHGFLREQREQARRV